MSDSLILAPSCTHAESASAIKRRFADSQSPGEVDSVERLETTVKKVKMCSIGVQTESNPAIIDVTLPLWALVNATSWAAAMLSRQGRKSTTKTSSFHLFTETEQVSLGSNDNESHSATASQAIAGYPNAERDVEKPFPLYPDIIQVIMRYLDTNELITSIQLSKQWLQSLKTAQSLGITSTADGSNLSRIPVNSTIARHVARAGRLGVAIDRSSNWGLSGVSLLSHLGMLLPNLKHLNFSCTNHSIQSYSLPPLLESLHLQINHPCTDLFGGVAQLIHLRELNLLFQSHFALNVDFSPLIRLGTRLESLYVTFRNFQAESLASLVAFVRQTRVNTLSCSDVSMPEQSELYCRLLERKSKDPIFPLMEACRLTSIDLTSHNLDGQLLQVLTQYPSLTKLAPSSFDLQQSDFSLFARLPNVAEFEFTGHDGLQPIKDVETVTSACQYLQGLRTLIICQCHLAPHQLDSCLSHLPHLTEFNWLSDEDITSLAALVKYDLPKRLKKLTLSTLSVHADELHDIILPLTNLEVLELEGCYHNGRQSPSDDLINKLRALPNLGRCDLNLEYEIRPSGNPAGFQFGATEFRFGAPSSSSSSGATWTGVNGFGFGEAAPSSSLFSFSSAQPAVIAGANSGASSFSSFARIPTLPLPTAGALDAFPAGISESEGKNFQEALQASLSGLLGNPPEGIVGSSATPAVPSNGSSPGFIMPAEGFSFSSSSSSSTNVLISPRAPSVQSRASGRSNKSVSSRVHHF